MSTIDRQSEYFVKLFESDPEGTNMFFDSPKVASNFQDNDEDAPLNLTPDINAIFEMMHKKKLRQESTTSSCAFSFVLI